jgi:hypothetical protein
LKGRIDGDTGAGSLAQLQGQGERGLDQEGFGGVTRLELEDETRREMVEAALGLALENQDVSDKAAAGRALRGGSFAVGDHSRPN